MTIEIREGGRSFVRFEQVPQEDFAKSREAGHVVMKDVEMVYITPAYTKDVIIKEVPAWQEQIRRQLEHGQIPQEHYDHYLKCYKNWKEGLDEPLSGTPIKGWPVLSPAQQQTLIAMHIRTVEDLANVNDEGLKRIGMGSTDMKNRAIAWLVSAQDKGKATIEIASLKAKETNMQGEIDALRKQVEMLTAQVQKEDKPSFQEPVSHETISAADLVDEPEDIVAQYTAKFGKPPHHRMTESTIRAKLME